MTAKKKTKTPPVVENRLLLEPLSEQSIILEVRVISQTAAEHVRDHLPGMRGGTGIYVFERTESLFEGGGITQVYRFREYLVADPKLRREQLQETRAWLEHAAQVALAQEWMCYRILDPRVAELDFHPVDLLFHSDYSYQRWQPFAYLDALKRQYRPAQEDG